MSNKVKLNSQDRQKQTNLGAGIAQWLEHQIHERLSVRVPLGAVGECSSSGSTFCADSELRSCVKVKVAVLGPPSLIVLKVSVDVKQH